MLIDVLCFLLLEISSIWKRHVAAVQVICHFFFLTITGHSLAKCNFHFDPEISKVSSNITNIRKASWKKSDF